MKSLITSLITILIMLLSFTSVAQKKQTCFKAIVQVSEISNGKDQLQ